MKTLLDIIRWIISIILFILTSIILLLFPILFSLNMIFAHRENPKQIFYESGIYEQLPAIIETSFTLTDSKIDLDILSPEFTQEIVENTINGIYNFLEGTSDTIQIPIEMNILEDKFLEVLNNTSEFGDEIDSLKDLPTCTPAQLIQMESVFETNELPELCLPDNINIDEIFNTAISEFTSSENSILPGEQIGDTFMINPLPNNIDTAMIKTIRFGYNIFKNITQIILLTLIILIPLTILITPNHKGMSKAISSTLLLISIPGLIIWGLYSLSNNAVISYLTKILNDPINMDTIPVSEVLDIVNILLEYFLKYASYIQIAMVILGILGFITIKYISKPKEPKPEKTSQEKLEEVVKKMEKETKK